MVSDFQTGSKISGGVVSTGVFGFGGSGVVGLVGTVGSWFLQVAFDAFTCSVSRAIYPLASGPLAQSGNSTHLVLTPDPSLAAA